MKINIMKIDIFPSNIIGYQVAKYQFNTDDLDNWYICKRDNHDIIIPFSEFDTYPSEELKEKRLNIEFFNSNELRRLFCLAIHSMISKSEIQSSPNLRSGFVYIEINDQYYKGLIIKPIFIKNVDDDIIFSFLFDLHTKSNITGSNIPKTNVKISRLNQIVKKYLKYNYKLIIGTANFEINFETDFEWMEI